MAVFLQLVPLPLYANIRLDPRTEYWQKSEHSKHQRRLGGLELFWDPSRGFRGQSNQRKFLGFKEHLDWFKIGFNAAEKITVQDYNKNQNIIWLEVHINVVKAKSQAGNIWVKHIMTKQAKATRYWAGDLKNSCILLENSVEGFKSRRERCWSYIECLRMHPKI